MPLCRTARACTSLRMCTRAHTHALLGGRSTGTLDIKHMRVDSVEIYSDAANAAVVRHPGRRYPGVLVQGDTLHSMHAAAVAACHRAGALDPELRAALEDLTGQLAELLAHYKATLAAHDIELPFHDV